MRRLALFTLLAILIFAAAAPALADGRPSGNGAVFWAYVSPQNQTANWVTAWTVTVSQGSWTGTITSTNPQQQPQSPGLSGRFTVTVTGSGPNMPEKRLSPRPGGDADITCHDNCAAMIGIIADQGGKDAHYWTTSDAICQ